MAPDEVNRAHEEPTADADKPNSLASLSTGESTHGRCRLFSVFPGVGAFRRARCGQVVWWKSSDVKRVLFVSALGM
jgi:hypothetical protein